jgi:hypothetical protein
LKFNPKDAQKCLTEGWYDAVITACVEEQSKTSGNDMFKCTYKVYGDKGESTIFDYIVFPAALWRLKKLCKAVGMDREFEAGDVDPSAIAGRSVRVLLKIEEDPEYGDKNRVNGWDTVGTRQVAPVAKPAVERPAGRVPVPANQPGYQAIDESDIPFSPTHGI